jgi:DNA repair exonuclease SbcCD ATPase subunit
VVSRLEIICKHLTEKVNFFLSKIMRDDIRLRFYMDEDAIDLEVLFNNKIRSVGNLSGGEEAKVGLSCMLGLRSLVPDRYQTNCLFLDEPDSGWDERVRMELYEILENTLSTTQLESIFLITHSPALQELQSWNSVWTCTKKNGLSSVEVVNR